MPIRVEKEVLDGLEAVRKSGKTNMFDRPKVIELAKALGYPETAEWVEKNREKYSEGIFKGFTSEVPGADKWRLGQL